MRKSTCRTDKVTQILWDRSQIFSSFSNVFLGESRHGQVTDLLPWYIYAAEDNSVRDVGVLKTRVADTPMFPMQNIQSTPRG